MRLPKRFPLACLAAAIALAGCEGTAPSTPSSLFTTESFNGSVVKGALIFHSFNTGVNGPVVIRLTAFNPANIIMGLALGTPATFNGANICSVTIGSAPVLAGSEFQVDLPPATYCVAIYDAGNVPDETTVTYSLTIQHK